MHQDLLRDSGLFHPQVSLEVSLAISRLAGLWSVQLEVAEGERDALISGLLPDTLYRVVVANDDLHQSHDEILVRTRAELPHATAADQRDIPELLVKWRHASNAYQVRNAFFARWEPHDRYAHAQVQ